MAGSDLMIAGSVPVTSLMETLSRDRPVFHSEADFQFAFARCLAAMAPSVEIRLEVRQSPDRAEYVDLACWTGTERTLIEFKYATSGWTGVDSFGEMYFVRNHAAFDLARRYFVHDIQRLERFVDGNPGTTGLALLLTNEPGLWRDKGRPHSRDRNFRIHEGQELAGHLIWGLGDTPRYDQTLRGSYVARWHDYSGLDGPKGKFRWLALGVRPENPSFVGDRGNQTPTTR